MPTGTGTPSQVARALSRQGGAAVRPSVSISRAAAAPSLRGSSSIDSALAAQRSGRSTMNLPKFDPKLVGGTDKVHPKAPGLLDQAFQMAAGAPKGIMEFGKEAIETATSVPHVAFDAATGNLPGSWGGAFERYAPAVKSLGTGFVESAKDVMDPSRFAEPGMMLPKLVNLGANVALVAAPVAGAIGTVGGEAAGAGARLAAEGAAAGAEGAGVVAPVAAEASAAIPGRGIAGYLARTGSGETAAALERFGQAVHRVGSLGAEVGNAPAAIYTKPLGYINEAIGGRLGEAALPFMSDEARAAVASGAVDAPKAKLSTYVGNRAVGTLTNPELPLGPVGKYIPQLTPERRELSNILGKYRSDTVEAGRDVYNRLRTEATPEIQAATVLSLDNRLRGLSEIGDRLSNEEFVRLLNESYAGLEPGQRPTPEEARLGIRAMKGELPSDQQRQVNTYAEQIRANVKERTDKALAGTGTASGRPLDPEQTGKDMLSSVVDYEMDKLRGRLDVTNRRKAMALRPATETTAQYGEALATAEDAMRGRPVVRGPDMPAQPPTVDLGDAGKVGQTRQIVKEHGDQIAQRHLDQIETFAGAEKPKFPSGKLFNGKKVGEGDWLEQLDKGTRMRLSTEGWFSKKNGQGMDIDVWADMLERNGAPGVHDIDSAVNWYLNEIQNVWDAKRGTHEEVLRNAGDQLGLDPNHVREIARGGRQGVADVIESMGDQTARIREEFRGLPEAKRKEFEGYIESLKEFGSEDSDYADVIDHFVEGFAGEGGMEAKLSGRVPMLDVAEYLIRESDPTYRPALPREIARMNRNVGSLLNEMRRRQTEYKRHARRAKMIEGQMENLHSTLDQPLQKRVAATGDAYTSKARNIASHLPEDVAQQAMQAVEAAVREADRVKGARLDLPRRINETLTQFTDHMTEAQRADLDRAMTRWQSRRARLLTKTFDRNMEAVPARFRPTLTAARDNVQSLVKMAEEATDPAARDHLLGLAEEITTNLSTLAKDGIDPAHLIGGMPRPVPGLAGALGTAQRKVSQEFTRKEGFGPVQGEAVMRTEAADAMNRIRNETLDTISERFGREASEIVDGAAEMAPAELTQAVRDAGYRALRAPGIRGGGLRSDTLVVPEQVYRVLQSWDKQMHPITKGLAFATGKLKTNLLPLSPRWHIGNVSGNILMAAVHGGVNPVRLASEMVKIARVAKAENMSVGELLSRMPAELTNYGLTHGERASLYPLTPEQAAKAPRTKFGELIQKSYNLNEFVDSYTRAAVYRAKLGNGVPSKVALSSTLKAMGDFTRMSPWERRVARQIIPFYPWMRHQTQAMLRLPIENPSRALFLGYLSNLYNDPSMTTEERRLLGLRLPVPGLGEINLNFLNPFPELPTSLGQIAQQVGQGINPLIKEPIAQVAGIDVGKLGQINRPADIEARAKGAFGQEPQSILGLKPSDLGASLYHAAGVLPGTRALRALIADPGQMRYSTGEQVGTKKSDKTRLQVLAQAAGIPSWDEGIDPKRLAELRKAAG